MIMKSILLIALLLLLNACVGTVRLAEENGIKASDSTSPAFTKGKKTEPKKEK